MTDQEKIALADVVATLRRWCRERTRLLAAHTTAERDDPCPRCLHPTSYVSGRHAAERWCPYCHVAFIPTRRTHQY